MKRLILNATPLILFGASAIGAYSRVSSENHTSSGEIIFTERSAVGPSTSPGSMDATNMLERMGNRIMAHNPPPPRKTYAGDVMVQLMNPGCYPGSGMPGIEYAMGWAEDAPEEMFAWLIDKNEEASFETYLLFRTWAAVDSEAALAAASRIPNAALRAQAWITTLEILCKTKPERAQKMLLENAELFATANGRNLIFQFDEIGAAWNLLLALPAGKAQTRLQAQLLGKSAHESARNVWDQASATQRQEWLTAGFTPSWGAGDSFAGLQDLMRETAEATGNPADAEKLIQVYGDAWAEKDLASAIHWAQAHLKGKDKIETMGKFFFANARKDIEQTLSVWQQMPASYLKKEMAQMLLRGCPEDRKAHANAILKIE